MFTKKTVYLENIDEVNELIENSLVDENIKMAKIEEEDLSLYVKLRDGITEEEFDKLKDKYSFIFGDMIDEVIDDYFHNEREFWVEYLEYVKVIEKIIGAEISVIEKHYYEGETILYIFEK